MCIFNFKTGLSPNLVVSWSRYTLYEAIMLNCDYISIYRSYTPNDVGITCIYVVFVNYAPVRGRYRCIFDSKLCDL